MIPVGVTCVYDEELGILQLGQDYIRAVEKAGGIPVPVVTRDEEILAGMFGLIGALVLSGGGDLDPGTFNEEPVPGIGRISPKRDFVELRLAGWALSRHLPVLGICRGIQVLNVAAGGTIYQDLGAGKSGLLEHVQKAPRAHPFHSVDIMNDTLLWHSLGCCPRIKVNSFHHQAVKKPGRGAVISALSPDGVIEALEFPRHPFALGVQWHPENLAADGQTGGQELFDALLQAAAKYQ